MSQKNHTNNKQGLFQIPNLNLNAIFADFDNTQYKPIVKLNEKIEISKNWILLHLYNKNEHKIRLQLQESL